jgi:hypothetical protein
VRFISGAALALSFASICAQASPYDPLIDRIAQQKGIDRFVLRAIATQESNKKPWTFNADGEGFHFKSKAQAVNALWSLTKAPWLVKIVPAEGGKTIRRFFSSSRSAAAFLNAYQRGRAASGKAMLTVRSDSGKEVEKGQARIRRVWLLNTDIGIAQINYRYHGQNKASVQRWFDPEFNLTYAAQHLVKMKRKCGSDLEAAGCYHSTTPSVRATYMKRFLKVYGNERKNSHGAVVAAN